MLKSRLLHCLLQNIALLLPSAGSGLEYFHVCHSLTMTRPYIEKSNAWFPEPSGDERPPSPGEEKRVIGRIKNLRTTSRFEKTIQIDRVCVNRLLIPILVDITHHFLFVLGVDFNLTCPKFYVENIK